jgi:sterol desaturase/sphingolipid hydroxylase (fatty acid hydroxylase superfamily)
MRSAIMKETSILVARAIVPTLAVVSASALAVSLVWTSAVLYAWVIRGRPVEWYPFAAVGASALVFLVAKVLDDYQHRNQHIR